MRIPCGTAFPPKCRFRDEQICQNERDAVARIAAYQVQAGLKAKDLQRFDPTKMGKEPPILVIPERTKPSEEEEGEER